MPQGSSVPNIPARNMKIGPVDGEYFDTYEALQQVTIRKEREAFESFQEYLDENAYLLGYVARQGDGEGGVLIDMLKRALFGDPQEKAKPYRKVKISQRLRTAVFERDAYRCKRCNSHIDLCADHIHPESLGGETTMNNLQTLCRPCNSSKGVRVETGGEV